MKLLILTAIIAAVTSSPLTQSKVWPWQVGKEYHYDVDTLTLTQYDKSDSNGNAFKAQFIVRVLAPGHLIAKLSKPLYAQIQSKKVTFGVAPSDLNYQPIQIIDEPFEIFVMGGRIESFNIPKTLSVSYENLLKGLISALQVDLSPNGHIAQSFPNSFDKDTFQGLFKKIESDITGDCETLYSVSPVSAQWRRELPQYASVEDPIEIIKSKNFAACKTRVAFTNDVPEGAVWNGVATENEEKQFIKHSSESRLIVGKQGTIYQAEVISTAYVSPVLFGKQKAEVTSHVKFYLSSVHEISGAEWKKPEASRVVDSLFFTLNETTFFPKAGSQNIEIAQKLLQEITPLLQNPSNLPKADFLSKFNILVRVLGVLNEEELKQLTKSVEIAKSSKNVAKNRMWGIYRDAVAQAGFHPSFEQIKTWILTKEVQGVEAADLISNVGVSLRFSNKALKEGFFSLMTSPVVLEQQTLNSSVLLAATKFFRFGEDDLYVVETVIPILSKELKQAVENGDSNKAQAYVRALGNLANPHILQVFAPYLDGRIAVTKYLRIQIVASLKQLANTKNDHVRAVLFSILRNTAEPYEVRVAAALNIFMAYPSAEMMQVMAHMTHDDPSTQVRAVLANSIAFAAGLKDPRFTELAKIAQSAKNFISQEKFGYRYSTDSMMDEYTSDDDIAYFRELSYIGSENSILPVYHRSALRPRSTAWTEEVQITLSVSDVQELLEYIAKKLYEPNQSKVDFKFSAKDIAQKLNLKRQPSKPIEGALFLEILRQQRLVTFNERDLNDFIANTVQNMEKLLDGVDVQYTKILSNQQVSVVFPLAAGVPFVFVYEEPLMYSINGQVKIKLDKSSKDFAGSLSKQLDFTYARNIDGSVGFLDTLGDVFAVAGVVNSIQFYFPANVNTGINPGEVKLNFVLPEQDVNFIHFGVKPYTSLQNKDSLLPIFENPKTTLIKRPAKVVSTEFNLAPLTGVAFVLQGYSYSSDFKNTKAYDGDILSSIGNLMYQKDVALTEFNLKYVAKETKNKDVTFSVFYDTLFNQKQSGEFGPASPVKDVNSKARREEIVKRAAAGINSADVQLYDVSAVFDGKQKVEYSLTAAIAKSFIDNKIQGAFFLNGCEQINAVFKLVTPKIAPLNFEEALKNKIYVTYEADLKYGNANNVHLQGFSERSEKYTELLKNDPLAKQCLQETSQKNFYQKDCYKMIIKAHAPDYFKATVTYKDLSRENLNSFFNTLESLKTIYSWEQEQDISKTIEEGKLEIVGQSLYYDNTESFEFTSSFGVFRLNNIEAMRYYVYANAYYGPITSWERSRNWFTGYQNLPYCAVDDNKVWTFSGRSYDYSLTSSWHVVMVDDSTDLVILARRPSDKQEEVYISYKNEDGKFVQVEIKPSSVEVTSNTKKVTNGALTTYWNDIKEVPLLQYYPLAKGVQVFNINNGALRLVYDSQRLVIFTSEHRTTTRGICGQSSSQISDDYMTPYGLVDLPAYYGASFSLDGEFSDPKTVALKKEAKLKAYQPVTKYTNILRSDAEWSKTKNQSF